MKLIYIAGPYKGSNAWEVEQNIRNAESCAHLVAKAGAFPVCPHSNVRPHVGCCQPRQFWLDGDCELLRRCDAVLLCPGWERSEGTLKEKTLAEAEGISCFETIAELENWMEISDETTYMSSL